MNPIRKIVNKIESWAVRPKAMANKETILDIAQAIDRRARDEKKNYRSNWAIARCLATMHSESTNINEGNKVFFLTNNEEKRGSFQKDFVGSGVIYQSQHSNTSSAEGVSVYKNTPLGEILIKFWRGSHPYEVKNRAGKIINRASIDIHNRATYNNIGSEIRDIEIYVENSENPYRYGKLSDLLRSNELEQRKLQEEREKMRKLQEEKRKREEEERIAREKAEEEERQKIEEEIRRREEEEKARQEEIDRLERSIEETNRSIMAIRNFLRTSVELRSQHVLDEYQEDAKRSHLFDGTAVVIDGGPGTGKTTTTIQRLKFLLSQSALNGYENPLTDAQIEYLTDPQEWNSRWLFFSPTDLLLKYLRNNMAQEELIADEKNTRTLERFRSVKMREYDLFNPTKDGPFKPYKPTDRTTLIKSPQKAILAFERFCIEFIRSNMEKRVALKTDQYTWHDIAVSIKATFANMKVRDLDGLMRMLNALSGR